MIQWANRFSTCTECGLKRLCFPKNLSENQIAALGEIIAVSHHYKRREYLYHSGDCLSDLIIIKSGSAKTELISETGDRQIVGFHFPGDLLGLDSFGSPQTRSSVVFLEDSSTCSIPFHSFNALSTLATQLQVEIIGRLSTEVALSHEFMLAMNHYSSEQRFTLFLVDLASRQHKRRLPDEHIDLSMSRNDIANYLGLAPGTISRIITKFEREGLIKVDNRHIQLADYQALINSIHACPDCAAMCV